MMIKFKYLFSILLSTSLVLSATQLQAKDYAIALSPFSSVVDKKLQVREIVKFISELKSNDHVWLLDGYSLETIGRVSIPDNPAYNSPKARIAVNRQAIAQLVRFAKTDNAALADTMALPVETIRAPQLLRSIANNKTHDNMEVIIFGSPHYVDRVDSSFSMLGQIPSTGHLLHKRTQTPYGLADDKKLLSNMRVHWFYGHNDSFMNERHSEAVLGFWTLYMAHTKGKLVSFSGDLLTLISRAKNNAKAPAHSYFLDPNDDKIEMVRLPANVMEKSIHERAISTKPITLAMLTHAQHVEVGIRWACDCDLDLYAQPYPNAAILYFGETETPDGIYFKDYQYAPSASLGFETIAFKRPLDLRVLKLAVNFYRGEVEKGIKGEIRLTIDGATYSKLFHIKANTGNKAKGVRALLNGGKGGLHSVLFEPASFFNMKR
jgi:hypothetical protein